MVSMRINEFKLERYFAKYEFKVKHILSPSDCESMAMKELLERADHECKKLWDNLKLGYTESQGHPLLRKEIAELYNHVSPEDVIVVAPEEGIFIAMNAILENGDEVIAIDPMYQSLQEIPRALHCTVKKWPLYIQGNTWSLDMDFLEQNITEKTRLVIINFPHNPTGYLPSKEEFKRLLEIAGKYGLYLFSDEMYWLSEHEQESRLPAVVDCYNKGISLFGLSKTFGLPGLRIGWLVTRDKGLMQRFTIWKDYTTICGSAPAEILAIIALRNKHQIISKNLSIIKDNLHAARNFFHKYPHIFTWLEPRAGSTAFPKLTDRISVADFCEQVLKEKEIMILPGDVFNFRGNHFRIGLGREDFKLILDKLEDYLKEMIPRAW